MGGQPVPLPPLPFGCRAPVADSLFVAGVLRKRGSASWQLLPPEKKIATGPPQHVRYRQTKREFDLAAFHRAWASLKPWLASINEDFVWMPSALLSTGLLPKGSSYSLSFLGVRCQIEGCAQAHVNLTVEWTRNDIQDRREVARFLESLGVED